VERRRLKSQAQAYRTEAKYAKQRGKSAMIGGILEAGTGFAGSRAGKSLLTGFGATAKGVPFGSAMTISGRTSSGGYVFG